MDKPSKDSNAKETMLVSLSTPFSRYQVMSLTVGQSRRMAGTTKDYGWSGPAIIVEETQGGLNQVCYELAEYGEEGYKTVPVEWVRNPLGWVEHLAKLGLEFLEQQGYDKHNQWKLSRAEQDKIAEKWAYSMTPEASKLHQEARNKRYREEQEKEQASE